MVEMSDGSFLVIARGANVGGLDSQLVRMTKAGAVSSYYVPSYARGEGVDMRDLVKVGPKLVAGVAQYGGGSNSCGAVFTISV